MTHGHEGVSVAQERNRRRAAGLGDTGGSVPRDRRFTPGTSDVHVHFVTEDGRLSGHVEDFVLAGGAAVALLGENP